MKIFLLLLLCLGCMLDATRAAKGTCSTQQTSSAAFALTMNLTADLDASDNGTAVSITTSALLNECINEIVAGDESGGFTTITIELGTEALANTPTALTFPTSTIFNGTILATAGITLTVTADSSNAMTTSDAFTIFFDAVATNTKITSFSFIVLKNTTIAPSVAQIGTILTLIEGGKLDSAK